MRLDIVEARNLEAIKFRGYEEAILKREGIIVVIESPGEHHGVCDTFSVGCDRSGGG